MQSTASASVSSTAQNARRLMPTPLEVPPPSAANQADAASHHTNVLQPTNFSALTSSPVHTFLPSAFMTPMSSGFVPPFMYGQFGMGSPGFAPALWGSSPTARADFSHGGIAGAQARLMDMRNSPGPGANMVPGAQSNYLPMLMPSFTQNSFADHSMFSPQRSFPPGAVSNNPTAGMLNPVNALPRAHPPATLATVNESMPQADTSARAAASRKRKRAPAVEDPEMAPYSGSKQRTAVACVVCHKGT